MNSRKVFIEILSELARKDPTIILLVMDVGFSYVEDFGKEFPDQYINLGVTEQSATGIAAGMALNGMKPYLYSMIPFVLFRPAEQVRDDIVNHNANVKLIGVKGSEHYKFLGKSHNLLHDQEDFNFCNNIGLSNFHPKTEEEIANYIRSLNDIKCPVYLRL